MQTPTTHPVLAFFAILLGFLLMISKISFLISLGALLIVAGMLAPFYRDEVVRFLQKISGRTKTAHSLHLPLDAKKTQVTDQAPSKAGMPAYTSETESAIAPLKKVIHIPAFSEDNATQGDSRILAPIWQAIEDLRSSLSKGSSSSGGQEIRITELKIMFIGNRMSSEIGQAKELIQLMLPGVQVKDVSTPVPPTTEQPGKENEGELKIELEVSAIA